MTLQEFAEIARLAPRASTSSLLAVDFKDSAQAAQFDVQLSVAPANSAAASGAGQQRTVSCAVRAPIGEQMRPHPIGEAEFNRLQGIVTVNYSSFLNQKNRANGVDSKKEQGNFFC